MVSFPPDFLIERRAIIADKINGENTIGVEFSLDGGTELDASRHRRHRQCALSVVDPRTDARGGGVFQMMARSVNEGGKVSPIAAIRNFQVLE